ncbi:MAG: hypothetical protein PHG06_21865 [Parabacteroides sp.]|nr:hypothetical protein [Parabacteroides sp.]
MDQFSFKKGWEQVQQKDAPEVKTKIMKALNLNPLSRASWKLRLDGTVEPKVSEAASIEAIFNEYGITEIWGS